MPENIVYDGLYSFIEELKKINDIIIINEFINPELEVTEIIDRLIKSSPNENKALLFLNNGTSFPLLVNIFASEKRMAKIVRVETIENIKSIFDRYFELINKPDFKRSLKIILELGKIKSYFPEIVKNKKAKCHEIIESEPDLDKLPILKCWPYDGGKFITLPIVHTIHPITKVRNIGMYRIQIFEKNLAAIHWHRHKGGAAHFEEYKKLKKKMPVAIALGGDPVYTYASTAPLPENIDEYILAGFLRKRKVKLVKCITQDIFVPEDSDIIIEGYIDPEDDFIIEGPFGDHTGFYSLPNYYPKFHVTCITHRKNAVYPATIVGIPPMEDAIIGKITEKLFLSPIKLALSPEITDIHFPNEGVIHNLVFVKIKKHYPGQAMKVFNSLIGAGQLMFSKIMIIFDEDVDLNNYDEIIKRIVTNVNPSSDIVIYKGPLDVLDHSATAFTYGGKLCIDATKKIDEEILAASIKSSNYQNINLNKEKKILKLSAKINFEIDDSLLSENKPFLIIYIDETKLNKIAINEFIFSVLSNYNKYKILYVVLIDESFPRKHYKDIIWYSLSNFDPLRDYYYFSSHEADIVVFDGTNKFNRNDHITQWPNITCMDDLTIEKIDNIWPKLNIGEKIVSPSKIFKPLIKNNDAVCKK